MCGCVGGCFVGCWRMGWDGMRGEYGVGVWLRSAGAGLGLEVRR